MNYFQLKLSICLAFGLFATIRGNPDFQWTDCGGSLVHFHQIDINPKPLVLSKTSNIYLTANVTIDENLPENAFVSLVINKTLTINGQHFPITIPCVDGMGSCRLKLCDIWSLWYKDVVCPFFTKIHRKCSCPVTGGLFTADKVKVDVPLDKFNGIIAEVADGDYQGRFVIEDANKEHQYACLDIKAHLTKVEH